MKSIGQIAVVVLLVLSVLSPGARAVQAASPTDGFNPGADGAVTALAVQADGKILVGGAFTTLGGASRSRIGRLNVDGSLDTGFNPGANGIVNALLVQADGKIVVGGEFTTLDGQSCSRVCRLKANGDLDSNFISGANGPVYALALQSSGKIVIGGDFTTLGGSNRSRIGRLAAEGGLNSFNPGANGVVYALALQADGMIVAGGDFTTLGGSNRSRIGRLRTDGGLDSFNPGADGAVRALVAQPDGKILAGGAFATLGGQSRAAIGRLNLSGSLDAGLTLGANAAVRSLVVQVDGDIVAGGQFTTLGGQSRSYIGRLIPGNGLDTTFTSGGSSAVYALVVQPDGKVLVGGNFVTLGGATRGKIARLNADGSLDTSFVDPAGTGTVYSLQRQPDGKVLVGGDFTSLGGEVHNNIARLNADGSLDTSFNPGTNGPVYALALQTDGKILVGGEYTTLNDVSRGFFGRLNVNGSLDTAYNPGADGYVDSLVFQPDGKLLVGGVFHTLGVNNGSPVVRDAIGRLYSDGSVDMSFNPVADTGGVRSMVIEQDGQIVLAGWFTRLGGQARLHIGRVNANGSLDTSFDPGANEAIRSLALQTDGKIILGGSFTYIGHDEATGVDRNYIARLNPDGSLDTSFDPGAAGVDNVVYSLALLQDGKMLVGGAFTTFGGLARSRLARLSADTAALQSIVIDSDGTSITWLRSGSNPEIQRVTFEVSTDASSYSLLGTASRVSGGWQLSGLDLATGQNLYIRARGYHQTGLYSASNSMIETVRNIYLEDGSADTPQPGPTYTVNTIGDNDGVCGSDDCSLREAIYAANGHGNGASPDVIQFNIATGCNGSTKVCTISPTRALPSITEAVRIDGFTQTGAVDNTKLVIELNGAGASSGSDGLTIEAADSEVRGLMINQFSGNGVVVSGSGATGNTLQSNTFTGNGGLGIDLADNGVTHNDSGDGDSGANRLQNFPLLSALTGATLSGSLNAAASTTYQLEFFASAACDNSGYGQGEALLGSKDVTTNSSGSAAFTFDFTAVSGKPYLSATATHATTGDTSEFSPCLPYTTTTSLSVLPTSSVYGTSVTLTATVTTGISESPYAPGQVQFKDGSTNLGGPVTLAAGQASYTTTTLSVGAHTLKTEYTASSSYSASTSNSIAFTVSKVPATVTLSGLNQTYTGAAKAATASTNPAGLSVTIVYTSGGTPVTPEDAGSYAVVATINDPVYQGSASGTLVIAPKGLTVSGVTANNRVYTGLTNATLNTGSAALVGVVSGDTVNLNTGSAAGTFADKNVGIGKTVTVSGLTISGQQAGNYTLTQPSTTANITAKQLTVSAENKTKVFGESLPLLTAGYSGFVNGETTAVLSGSPILTTTATAASPVGSYPITVTQGTLSAQNYSFTFPANSGQLTINKANSVTGLQLSAGTVAAGQPVTLTATVSAAAPGAGLPTGQVTFKEGSTILGTQALAGGVAQITFSSTKNGTHNLSVSYAGNASFNPSDSTSVALVVSESADLSLTLSALPDPVASGEDLVYQLTVTNQGPSAATGVNLTVTLPGGVMFKSATVGCVEAGGVVTCAVGALASAAAAGYEITVSVPEDASASLACAAQVAGLEYDPQPDNNHHNLSVNVAGMQFNFYLPVVLARKK